MLAASQCDGRRNQYRGSIRSLRYAYLHLSSQQISYRCLRRSSATDHTLS